jgi:hypothetical protein
MMTMCWKYLVPIAFVNLIGAAAWMLWVPAWVHYLTTAALFFASVAGILMFLRRVVWHLEYANLGREHLSFNPLGTARSPG